MGDRTEDREGILPKEEGRAVRVELAKVRGISRGQRTVWACYLPLCGSASRPPWPEGPSLLASGSARSRDRCPRNRALCTSASPPRTRQARRDPRSGVEAVHTRRARSCSTCPYPQSW